MFDIFANADAWVALLTLTFLEIVLGIDNIIFISIAAGKLEPSHRKKATNLGLVLAMVMRILLLFGIYKSTKEIHEKVEDKGHDEREVKKARSTSLTNAILQITVINIVFSFDSILTAIGMTNGISPNPNDALVLMIVAVVISVVIMMLFANPVGEFVNRHPSIQILGLSFLILIGFMLIAESAHLSHLIVFGNEVGVIPKGYLYFSIAFSLMVEFFDLRMKKNKDDIVDIEE